MVLGVLQHCVGVLVLCVAASVLLTIGSALGVPGLVRTAGCVHYSVRCSCLVRCGAHL
jgi:hypothetical protein